MGICNIQGLFLQGCFFFWGGLILFIFVFNKTRAIITSPLVRWLKIQMLWRTWISACIYIRTFSFAGFLAEHSHCSGKFPVHMLNTQMLRVDRWLQFQMKYHTEMYKLRSPNDDLKKRLKTIEVSFSKHNPDSSKNFRENNNIDDFFLSEVLKGYFHGSDGLSAQ